MHSWSGSIIGADAISNLSIMDTLMTVYISATIFGGGVMLTDLFGLLSSSHDGDAADGHSSDDGDGDIGGDDDDGSADDEGDDSTSHETHHGVSEHQGAAMMHGNTQNKRIVVRMIGLLKNTVYFSVGFGSVGWFALATGYSGVGSLIWSIPMGAVVMMGTRLIKRIQRNELNSNFTKEELLFKEAVVLVSIGKGQIGKIRIKQEGASIDRFAKAFDEKMAFPKGATVRIMEIDDEYFFVGN